ncbi:hypothetical protein AN639_03720 [Candidatus Epulonipiscium fishelsonii]|uniref:Uncharacterized protein n=1 Tax=Candidatus Epulonipiscium fishelsonii TaxID=77094 RepID=A0ACC8X6Z3_9FIRM|nr:hypothetical protein AN396_12805 [Epulopiscium sp. SCG-B11WGA-EpuloA1]ONI41470.1 hypothetical protein AN639_03720 [Epulopiscium sp. SCG-B05WGA-EpuloA1]
MKLVLLIILVQIGYFSLVEGNLRCEMNDQKEEIAYLSSEIDLLNDINNNIEDFKKELKEVENKSNLSYIQQDLGLASQTKELLTLLDNSSFVNTYAKNHTNGLLQRQYVWTMDTQVNLIQNQIDKIKKLETPINVEKVLWDSNFTEITFSVYTETGEL